MYIIYIVHGNIQCCSPIPANQLTVQIGVLMTKYILDVKYLLQHTTDVSFSNVSSRK